ncbi:MAG: helix-turn-helix domain-containing protein [Candidatus Acidiferrales bacterium]
MSFIGLQESLRRELRKRIEGGELTGIDLARRSGFTQAHISNFLNRKRGLKLSALDRILKALGLSVYDLLNPHDLARFAAAPLGTDEEYSEVPRVESGIAASRPVIVNEDVLELCKIKRDVLGRIRPDLAMPPRRAWTRWVLISLESSDAPNLAPRLLPGAVLLVDRHYTSLRPYHRNERNLYAVRKPEGCVIRSVELGENLLVLRPSNPAAPVEILALREGQSYSDFVAGRIAGAAGEL